MPKVVGQDDSIKKRYTCKSCGAINEVYPNEIVALEKVYSRYTAFYKYGFYCAQCNSKVITQRI